MNASKLQFALAAFCLFAVSLRSQMPQTTEYNQTIAYVKVAPGKGDDYVRLMRETNMKTSQIRANEGRIVSWTLLRCVMPAGTEARANYMVSVVTTDPLPRPATESEIDADLKKAGVAMSSAEFRAKRDSLSHLVSYELWRMRHRVGNVEKGHYLFVNLMRVHDAVAYRDFEGKVWRPVAEAAVKDGVMGGWIVATKVLPSGSDTDYTAYTADIFPSWDDAFKAASFGPLIQRVHPGADLDAMGETMTKARSLASRELWVVVERVVKATP